MFKTSRQFLLLLTIFLIACHQPASSPVSIKRGIKPVADNEQAVIETDFGDITIELYSNLAPLMVERFKRLINEGFYDGTTFHRIDPALGIIQGGDPLSKDSDPENDGAGSSNYPDVAQEFSDVPYDAGIVGAARSNSPDSANCQFFITLKRQGGFDERYTIFGRVVSGLTNAQVISTAPAEVGGSRPQNPIVIKRITLKQDHGS